MSVQKEPKVKTLAELRAERQHALACNTAGPPVDTDEVYPTCNRIGGHAPPHRLLRISDFAVLAEWDGDTYSTRPPKKAGR